MTDYYVMKGNIQARLNPSAPVTNEWRIDLIWTDAAWQIEGSDWTDRWSRFIHVDGLPAPGTLPEGTKSRDVLSAAAAQKIIDDAAAQKAAQAEADRLAALKLEQEQLAAKSQMLQSGTAIWSSKEVLEAKARETAQAISEYNAKVQTQAKTTTGSNTGSGSASSGTGDNNNKPQDISKLIIAAVIIVIIVLFLKGRR